MAKINANEQAEVVGYVNQFKTDILEATTRLRKVWLELYRNYRTFKSLDKQAWQSKLWIPKTFTVIEQIASRTTAHNPKFNLKALQSSALQMFTTNQEEIDEALVVNKEIGQGNTELTPMDVPQPQTMSSRDILEAYLLYVFTENQLKQKIRLWDKGRLIYGSYHIKIDPKILTEKKIKKRETEDGIEEVEEEIFKNILPDVDIVDVFDLLIHPDEENLDTATGIIHKRDKVCIDDLDDETYFNLDLIDNSRGTPKDITSEELEKRQLVQDAASKNIDKDSFTVNEYWGWYKDKEMIITIVNDSLVIRYEENKVKDSRGNPIRPFIAMHDQPVPGEYYAIGDAEPIMSLQTELNHLRNTRTDFNNSVLYPEWIMRKDSGINPFQLIHKPNNIVQVVNMEDLKPLEKDTVPNSGYREEEAINRDIQDTTSTTNFAQPGATSAFTDTASGASMRQQEQNTRMRLKIEYLDDAVSELGRKILIYASHYLEDSIEVPMEDEFITIYKDTFKKIAQGFNPVVVSGSMAADTPSERRNEAIARGNISLQYQGAGVPVDLKKEYLNIMSEGFNVKDEESLLGETTSNVQDGQNQLLEQPQLSPNQI